MRSLLRFTAVAALATFSCFAQSLSGRVVSPANVPLAGIVVDAGSGSTPATTDAAGLFTITGLQNGNDYDVEYVPAAGVLWAARVVTSIVNGATNVGDVVLQPGFSVSGTARTEAGVPIAGCNLNAYTQGGVKLFTPRDGTDALGNFQIIVPAGTWDVRIVPPVGSLLVPKQFEDVAVGAAVALGNVLLPTAYLVTGTIVSQLTSVPVGNVRIRAYNALNGERIYVPVDTATTFGQFSLPLPYGLIDLELEPPVGNTHVARQVLGVAVPGPTALGQVRLQNGALLSGTVTQSGLPVAGADVDVLLADGTKVFTPRDTTAANGTFTVAVPTGVSLQVRAEPLAGSGLYGAVTAPQVVTAASSVGTIALGTGVAVTGTISGPLGAEAGASVRFFLQPGDVQVVTAGSVTDAAGNYATFVPPGSYRIEVATAEGSFGQPVQQFVTIGAATMWSTTVPVKLARTTLTSFGIPTVPQGGLLPINVLLHSMQPGLQTLLLDLLVELPDGTQLWILPGLPLDLPPLAFTLDAVFVPFPPIPANYLGKQIDMVFRFRDATGAVVLDQAKTPFVVQ